MILAIGYADLSNGEDPGLPRASAYQKQELAMLIAQVFVPAHDDNAISIEAAQRG
jgi:hypothetical protein